MRKATIATAVTTGVVAAVARRPRRPASPRRTRAVVPPQRSRTVLERLVEGDAELVIAEQDARDAHILQALEHLVGRAS